MVKSSIIKRINSLKRIEQSYEYIKFGLKDATDNDIIIFGDNDEIPDLKKCNLKNIKKNLHI